MSQTNRWEPQYVQHCGEKPQVLIVDDSRAHRKMLSVQLTRAGYRVKECGDGKEALVECARQMPDIILSDWLMPELNGPELCEAVRKLPSDRYAYFVLLSSKTDKSDITQGLERGADDFLTKPISSTELIARLRAGERILSLQAQQRHTNEELTAALDKLRKAQRALDTDLREARKLQQGLLRERHARFGSFSLSFLLRPAGHVGGDLVGFFPINSRRTGIYAIDVSGHGVAAALMTARLASLLSSSAEQNAALQVNELGLYDARPPADLARYLNHLLIEDVGTDTYFTMLYASLDHVSGELSIVQAGHPHPLLQRANGEIEVIGQGGLPIGAFSGASYDEIRLKLEPGDRLLIASDGITEANAKGGTMLGDDGLSAILRTNTLCRGEAFLESMCWSVGEYSSGDASDDVSAVLIEHDP